MNLSNVMDQIAIQLDTIAGLHVYAYPADSITPPAAIVGYPETITYDVTFGRGVDQIDLPVFVLVERTPDRTARATLAPYLDGSGAESFKAVLKAGTYTAFSTARVRECTIDVITVAGTDYLTGIFGIDITGPGV